MQTNFLLHQVSSRPHERSFPIGKTSLVPSVSNFYVDTQHTRRTRNSWLYAEFFYERVLWQVPKSLENLTTVKLKQNSVEGLMELLHDSRLARQIRAFLRG